MVKPKRKLKLIDSEFGDSEIDDFEDDDEDQYTSNTSLKAKITAIDNKIPLAPVEIK
jgi:hypothetical protein